MNIILRIMYKCGLKKRPTPKSKEEMWRERGVTIGEHFSAYDSTIDYCFGHLVTIGDYVTLSGVTILAHDGSTKDWLGYSKVAPVKIGNNVFIGYGSIVLPGETIGNKVIIGAGTIVSKDIPDNVVVVRGYDSTYRIISSFDEYLEKNRQLMKYFPISNINCLERTDDEWKEWKKTIDKYGKGFDL